MNDGLLPFERSFRDWIERQGMGWVEGGAGGTDTLVRGRSYCLRPRGRPRRGVVAVHGAGNDALFGWVGLFKELLRDDTLVYSFDLPGHGRNGQSRLDIPSARDAIADAVRECAGCVDGMPVHAVGVSLGGSLLLDSLPELAGSLASAALIVAPLHIHLSLRSLLPEIGPRTLALVWKEREHYGLGGLIPSFGPFKRDIYPLRLSEDPPAGSFGYVDALNAMLDELDLQSRADAVSVPVLLAYGEADRVVPLEQGERLARRIHGSTLLPVRDGTHLSTPLSMEVRRAVAEWIGRWD